MSYSVETMTGLPTPEGSSSPNIDALTERQSRVDAKAAEYLRRIRTEDPFILADQLAEESVTSEEEISSLKEIVDHDDLNPEIFSGGGFYKTMDGRLREMHRDLQQRQHDQQELPKRMPGIFGFLDLDKFKEINDHYDHTVGDAILNLVGQLINSELRPGDVVARLHGDEFVFYLQDVDDIEQGAVAAERIRNTLIDAVPLVSGLDINLSASIGLVMFPAGEVLQQLNTRGSRHDVIADCLGKADNVHNKAAKNAGKNRIGVQLKDGSIKTAVFGQPDIPENISYEEPKFVANGSRT